MTANDYFQSFKNYFWQWEENTEVLAIPDYSTIAYRKMVVDILEKLIPQGVPPFGSLLLAIIATNPQGKADIDTINRILCKQLGTHTNGTLIDAIAFMNKLAELPDNYKQGINRLLLFQTIFEGCHNIVSTKNSMQLLKEYEGNTQTIDKIVNKLEFSAYVFAKDFRTVGLLNNKFENTTAILNSIASLPDFSGELFTVPEHTVPETGSYNFVEQLIDNNKTFHVGTLIKSIWGGLHIPAHSALPSQQPLGGFSDLANKGDLDKLLVSEFANDDIVFLSRLANNEALYIQREIPPMSDKHKRIFLIDVSLKNWGTPKTLAFATMLAIANHPKTTIECKAYAIGNICYPLSITSIDTIIQGLQILDGSLHSAIGLEEFFKNNPPDRNCEIFLLTEQTTIKNIEMLRALQTYQALIQYIVYTNATGNIDVYKNRNNSKKHIQHFQLSLEELWKREPSRTSDSDLQITLSASFPLLIRSSASSKKILTTTDGSIFQITSDKMLLRFFDKSYEVKEKGWELVYDNLPSSSGEFEIGVTPAGEYILMQFNPQNREIVLLNVSSGERKSLFFEHWRSSRPPNFVFYEQQFYHRNQKGVWTININGSVAQVDIFDDTIFTERDKELKDATIRYSYSKEIFKNITTVFINESNNLVFNIHELNLSKEFHIKLNTTRMLKQKAGAKKISQSIFEFDDGSRVEVHRCGMLKLQSSDKDVPTIYIPSVLDASLGIATKDAFAGNDYYYKEEKYDIILHDFGGNPIDVHDVAASLKKITEIVQSHTHLGLNQAEKIVLSAPHSLQLSVSKKDADALLEKLQANGAKAEVELSYQHNEETTVLNKISTKTFYDNYIEPFITTILANGFTN